MTDTKNNINCPACGHEMKKVFIENAGVNIDICIDGCGGMLFDNRELEKFDEKHENADEILNEVKDKEFISVDESATRICPICNTPMVKFGAGNGNVQIDLCNACGAKFLDFGELEKIREADGKENEVLAKILAKSSVNEKEALRDTVGTVGVFIHNFFGMSNGRKNVENFIKKII